MALLRSDVVMETSTNEAQMSHPESCFYNVFLSLLTSNERAQDDSLHVRVIQSGISLIQGDNTSKLKIPLTLSDEQPPSIFSEVL